MDEFLENNLTGYISYWKSLNENYNDDRYTFKMLICVTAYNEDLSLI
jgi:hypothetical protein